MAPKMLLTTHERLCLLHLLDPSLITNIGPFGLLDRCFLFLLLLLLHILQPLPAGDGLFPL